MKEYSRIRYFVKNSRSEQLIEAYNEVIKAYGDFNKSHAGFIEK